MDKTIQKAETIPITVYKDTVKWIEISVCLKASGLECRVAIFEGQNASELASALQSVLLTSAKPVALRAMHDPNSPILPLTLVCAHSNCLSPNANYEVILESDETQFESSTLKTEEVQTYHSKPSFMRTASLSESTPSTVSPNYSMTTSSRKHKLNAKGYVPWRMATTFEDIEDVISRAISSRPILIVFVVTSYTQRVDVQALVPELKQKYEQIEFLLAPSSLLESQCQEHLVQVLLDGIPSFEGVLKNCEDLERYCRRAIALEEESHSPSTKESSTRLATVLSLHEQRLIDNYEANWMARALDCNDPIVSKAFVEFETHLNETKLAQQIVGLINNELHRQEMQSETIESNRDEAQRMESMLQRMIEDREFEQKDLEVLKRRISEKDPVLMGCMDAHLDGRNIDNWVDLKDTIKRFLVEDRKINSNENLHVASSILRKLFVDKKLPVWQLDEIASMIDLRDPVLLGIFDSHNDCELNELVETLEMLFAARHTGDNGHSLQDVLANSSSPTPSAPTISPNSSPYRDNPRAGIYSLVEVLQLEGAIDDDEAARILEWVDECDPVIAAAHSLYRMERDWMEFKDTVLRCTKSEKRRSV